jgi:hypothetical protein
LERNQLLYTLEVCSINPFLTMYPLKRFFLSFGLLPCTMLAQHDVVAGGGNASSTAGSISYSIGQVVYTNESNASGSIQLGVQQPYTVTPIAVHEPWRALAVGLYPNPTRGQILIEMPEFISGITASIFDMGGSLVEQFPLQSAKTLLSAEEWPAGQYIIQLIDASGNTSQYKLVKQ